MTETVTIEETKTKIHFWDSDKEREKKYKDTFQGKLYPPEAGKAPLPKVGKSQPKGEGRNKEPRGRAEEGKNSRARIPGSLDRETDMDRPMGAQAISVDLHRWCMDNPM